MASLAMVAIMEMMAMDMAMTMIKSDYCGDIERIKRTLGNATSRWASDLISKTKYTLTRQNTDLRFSGKKGAF